MLRIEPLTQKSFRLYSSMGVYMDLVLGREKALLIDTGYGMEDLPGVVRSLTDLPLLIVNTHGHVDHACGNDLFEEPVYIHPADEKLCREHTGRLRRVLALELARQLQDGIEDGFDEARYLNRREGRLLPLQEEQVFDLGGEHLRVIGLPGHTRGSIGLFWEEEGILYAGDAFNKEVWLFLPEAADLGTYQETLKKAMGMDIQKVVYSHEPGFGRVEELEEFLEVAENLDYEAGEPFWAPLVPGATARKCFRKETGTDKKGPSIIVNRDHL